jgi:hypothetical protein
MYSRRGVSTRIRPASSKARPTWRRIVAALWPYLGRAHLSHREPRRREGSQARAHLRFVKNFAGLPFFFMEERAACCDFMPCDAFGILAIRWCGPLRPAFTYHPTIEHDHKRKGRFVLGRSCRCGHHLLVYLQADALHLTMDQVITDRSTPAADAPAKQPSTPLRTRNCIRADVFCSYAFSTALPLSATLIS